jgi:hypothetical protein
MVRAAASRAKTLAARAANAATQYPLAIDLIG